jgi:hypothetical protein
MCELVMTTSGLVFLTKKNYEHELIRTMSYVCPVNRNITSVKNRERIKNGGRNAITHDGRIPNPQ